MYDATPTRTPQITIAFTVGDLRGNTEPLGTFASREGAEHYGRALFLMVFDNCHQKATVYRVKAFGRLIENQQLGVGHDRNA
jgi:hypothetical protein